MEVHLAQLPTELALMFRNLFGPLWKLLTDTIMGAISDALKKVLGPASDALGMAEGALGQVSGFISDVQKKAQEAQAYAKNVEDKAGKLMDSLSKVSIGTNNPDGFDPVQDAANALAAAVGENPFSSAAAASAAQDAVSGFPGNRSNAGKGIVITGAMYEEVKAKHQYDDAIDPEAEEAPDEGEPSAGEPAPDEGAGADAAAPGGDA